MYQSTIDKSMSIEVAMTINWIHIGNTNFVLPHNTKCA